jgi:hypothetical protein
MAYSRTRRVASVCSLLLATLQLCSALHDNSNTSPPVPALVPRAVDDPDIAAAIAKYQETYACFERDDGQGPCFLEQCREACAFPKDRVPEDCHDNDVSRKWKREESEEKIPAIVGSVSCMIETEWQSADGSGEPIEGECTIHACALMAMSHCPNVKIMLTHGPATRKESPLWTLPL